MTVRRPSRLLSLLMCLMREADFPAPLPKERKKKPKLSPQVSEVPNHVSTMIKRFDRVKAKVDRMKERLNHLEESSLALREIVERI